MIFFFSHLLHLVVGKDTLDDCVGCDPGYYCQYEGQSNITGMCIEGFYCNGNASIPNPEGQ